MKVILVLGFAISGFIASAIAHAATATDIPVIGAIDGIVLEGDQYYIDGWACQKTATTPLRLHIYAGASAYDSPQGVYVASGSVQYAAEQSIKNQCASQALARFHVAISDAVLAANAGKKVYVHGLRVIGDVENSALTNSGSLSFPAPIAQNPRGCMPSIRTELTDRNTYPSADAQGQGQDWVYKAWVWRDTTDVSTNHSVSVARSKDLKNWYNTCGEKLTLPINSRARATLDPIQMNQGLLNNVKVGFDNLGNPIVTYQKYKTVYSTTAAPYVTTQVYNARLENGVWNIHQVTNWTTKNYLYGGGAIPSDPTTIAFSAVQPDPAGNNIQTLNRASSDLTGTPTSGAWILDNQLNVTSNKAPINLDPFHPTFSPAAMPAPEPRVDGWVTPFKYRRYWARTQRDAIVLRGNWDGDGSRGGIFMQKTRTFYLFRQDGTRSAIPFGPGSIPLLPLVGDWNNDGLSTIGVLDSITSKYYLKNTLAGGGADLSGIGSVASLADTDGPMHWSSVDPSHTYYLSHEYIPTNRD